MTDKSQTSKHKAIPVPEELEGKILGTASKISNSENADGLIAAPNAETDVNADFLVSYAEHLHSYVREYISVADRKASFTFAIGAVLLVYLYEKNIAHSWMKATNLWGFSDFVACVASVGLFVSVVLAVAVVFPRMSGSRRGFVFWESIAEFETATEFSDTTSTQSRANLTNEMLRHIFELSCVCKSKYKILNWSLRVGGVGAVSAILHLFL